MGVSRRQLIAAGSVGLLFGCRHFDGEPSAGEKPLVRFGMVTDLHYADIPPDSKPCGPVGRRYYRESKRKLREAENTRANLQARQDALNRKTEENAFLCII